MTEPVKAAVSSAAHPVETASDLAAETEEGRSWRTPFLALGGVTLVVAAIVLVVVVVAVVAYELAT
jgi:hypothetical protein